MKRLKITFRDLAVEIEEMPAWLLLALALGFVAGAGVLLAMGFWP